MVGVNWGTGLRNGWRADAESSQFVWFFRVMVRHALLYPMLLLVERFVSQKAICPVPFTSKNSLSSVFKLAIYLDLGDAFRFEILSMDNLTSHPDSRKVLQVLHWLFWLQTWKMLLY